MSAMGNSTANSFLEYHVPSTWLKPSHLEPREYRDAYIKVGCRRRVNGEGRGGGPVALYSIYLMDTLSYHDRTCLCRYFDLRIVGSFEKEEFPGQS